MSANLNRNRHIRALAYAAADMLAADPALRVVEAAQLVGVGEQTVRTAWHAAYPGHPRRPVHRSDAFISARTDEFSRFCSVMLEKIRGDMTSAQIFEAMRAAVGDVNERRLWRALRCLVESGKVRRIGMRCSGSMYRRTPPARSPSMVRGRSPFCEVHNEAR